MRWPHSGKSRNIESCNASINFSLRMNMRENKARQDKEEHYTGVSWNIPQEIRREKAAFGVVNNN
jgi:hypothetical protein